MKKINPFYIIILLIVILVVVMFNLMHVKNELHEAHNSFDKTKAMVHKIVDLQQNWDNKKSTKNSIRRILRSSVLRNAGVIQKDRRGVITLHASSMNSKSVSYLISRLLNETFTIKSMKIRRLNKERASLDVEIKL
jgi:competence protein ComGC